MPRLFEPGNKAAVNRGPNKVSTKVKESIVHFLEDNVDKIQESFDQLKARDKLQFIADILPYAAPKLASIQTENHTTLDATFKVTLNINGGNRVHKAVDAGLPDEDNRLPG